MRCLLVKKAFSIALFYLVTAGIGLYGQSRTLKNNPRYDRKPLHFGFSIGANYYDLRLEYLKNLANQVPGYFNARSEVAPGYTISIISNLRLGKYWDLRFNPGFASTVRTLYFDIENPFTGVRSTEEREIESSFLEFPLHFKFKSERIGNYRLYLLAGPKYALDLSSDEDVQDDRVFKLKQNDFSYELGFGTDIYFEYFKFSPQIIASFGLSNQIVRDDTFLVEGLNGVFTRCILINLTFE
jgi:hypothetical protein